MHENFVLAQEMVNLKTKNTFNETIASTHDRVSFTLNIDETLIMNKTISTFFQQKRKLASVIQRDGSGRFNSKAHKAGEVRHLTIQCSRPS